jgi:hypothetical protein
MEKDISPSPSSSQTAFLKHTQTLPTHHLIEISPPTMTRVLLTGGSGFIATHILQLLLERGYVPNATADMAPLIDIPATLL